MRSHKILVIEDDGAVLDAVKMVFTHAGLTPLTASSPEQALELWEENPEEIKAVVADFDLKTSVNGIQLCERFRRQSPGIFTILLSGHSFSSAQLGRVEGINFFPKPFSIRALTAAVKETLTPEPLQESSETR